MHAQASLTCPQYHPSLTEAVILEPPVPAPPEAPVLEPPVVLVPDPPVFALPLLTPPLPPVPRARVPPVEPFGDAPLPRVLSLLAPESEPQPESVTLAHAIDSHINPGRKLVIIHR